jgi:MbtH protein
MVEEYISLVNIEGQYSLWPANKEIPLGWKQEGSKGSKETCLEYIKNTWTDMRPISLRKQMEDNEKEHAKK